MSYVDGPAGPVRVLARLNGRPCEVHLDSCSVAHVLAEGAARTCGVEWRRASNSPALRGYGGAPIAAIGAGSLALEVGEGGAPVSVPVVIVADATTDIPVLISAARLLATGALATWGPAADGGYWAATPGAQPARLSLHPDLGGRRVAAVLESVEEVQVQWAAGAERGVELLLAPAAAVDGWLAAVRALAGDHSCGGGGGGLVSAVDHGQPRFLYVPPAGEGEPAVVEEPYSVRGPAGCTDELFIDPWLGEASPSAERWLRAELRTLQDETGIFHTGDPERDGHTFPPISSCPPMDVHLVPDVDFSRQPKPRLSKGAYADLSRAAGLAMLKEKRGRFLVAPQGCVVSVLVVPKHDETGERAGERLVYDFRFQNQFAIAPVSAMPSPLDCAAACSLGQCVTVVDANSAFLQITLARPSCHLSTTAYAPGLYVEPHVANMGQVGAPAHWQQFIDSVLPPYPASPHVSYIDDMRRIHFTLDPWQVAREVVDTCRRLAAARVALKVKKARIAVKDSLMAGLRVRHNRISVPCKRLAFLEGQALPASVPEARSLLAFMNAWRMFAAFSPEDAAVAASDPGILGFAAMQRPIEDFLRSPGSGPLDWDRAPAARDAMRALLDGLPHSSRELFPFTAGAPTCVVTDASPISMVGGWQVWQRVDARWRLVFCDSFMLTEAKSKRWQRLGVQAGAFDAELTAMERCVERVYPYLAATPGVIVWHTDAQILVDGVNNISFSDPATIRRVVALTSLLPIRCAKVPRELMPADIMCLKWSADAAAAVAAAQASEVTLDYTSDDVRTLRSRRGLVAPLVYAAPLTAEELATATAADELGALLLAGARGAPLHPDLLSLHPRAVDGRVVLSLPGRGDVWFMPLALRGEVLRFAHDRRMHPGSEEVLHHLLGLVWWPGLRADVTAYVAACSVCARDRVTQARQTSGAIPIPALPCEEIHLDVAHVGGVPVGVALRGDVPYFPYVLVAVDALSAVVHTRPLMALSAVCAARALQLLLADFRSTPQRLVLDGDPAFSPLVREGLAMCGMLARVVAPQAHQGNLAERAIRSVREMAAREEHEVGYRDVELQWARAAAQASTRWTRVLNASPMQVLTGVAPVSELGRVLGPVPAPPPAGVAVAPPQMVADANPAPAVVPAVASAPPAELGVLPPVVFGGGEVDEAEAVAAAEGDFPAPLLAPPAPVSPAARARFAAAAEAKEVSRARGRASRNARRRGKRVVFVVGDVVVMRSLTEKVRSAQTARRWSEPYRVFAVFDDGNSVSLETLDGARPAHLAKVSAELLRRAPPAWDGAPAAAPRPPAPAVAPPEEYVVDRIVGYRRNARRGQREEWHVIWKGFPVASGTWEPRASLEGNVVWRKYEREHGRMADSGTEHEEEVERSALSPPPRSWAPASPLFARAPVLGDSDDDSFRRERRALQAQRRAARAQRRRARAASEEEEEEERAR